MKQDPHPTDFRPESAFDLHARAELAVAFEPGEPPAHLLRTPPPLWKRRPLLQLVAVALLAATGTGAVLAVRPPSLVRDALEHEYHERTLRGSFMDARSLLAHLGLPDAAALPGYPQLMRPCDIDGHVAYHLTTFFEKGGIVTVYAFDQPVDLSEGGGWWANMHWKVIRSREGKPLLLVSQKEKALSVAQRALQTSPRPAAG